MRSIIAGCRRPLLVLLAVVSSGVAKTPFSARSCSGIRNVHIAVGKDPTSEMTVSFAYKYYRKEFRHHADISMVGGVMVGLDPDHLDLYFEEDEPAQLYNGVLPAKHGETGDSYASPLLHHVPITGLQPYTTYYYKCVVRPKQEHQHAAVNDTKIEKNNAAADATNNAATENLEEMEEDVYEDEDSVRGRQLRMIYYDNSGTNCPDEEMVRFFRTAPNVADSIPLKFAYMGDIGQFRKSLETLLHLVKHNGEDLDAIMLAGDIAYTQYDLRRWDTFFDFLDDFSVMDLIPFHVVPGNHDIEKSENERDLFTSYEKRFRMPRIQPAVRGLYDGPDGYLNMDTVPYPLPYDYGNSFYSFVYGKTVQIFLNPYTSVEPTSPQYQWLQQRLQEIDRSMTPWVIVTMHTPLYNTFAIHRHDEQIIQSKEYIEPLLVQHKVNLVFAGHVHAYQRTKAVALDKVDPTGPVHLIIGAGGRQCKASFKYLIPEEWVAVRDATHYGYGTLQIFNDTHAQWDWFQTGDSDFQNVNDIWKEDVTLPPVNGTDTLVLYNQWFL